MFAFLDESRFESLRRRMVDEQLAGQGIRDERVLDAIRRIPRHLFVPSEVADQSYENHPVAIGRGQTISQPYMVACMTQALAPRTRKSDRGEDLLVRVRETLGRRGLVGWSPAPSPDSKARNFR